jgi:hypothetical protein
VYLKEYEEANALAAKNTSGGFDKSNADSFDADLDEFVVCAKAFQKLKDLVQTWLKDVF